MIQTKTMIYELYKENNKIKNHKWYTHASLFFSLYHEENNCLIKVTEGEEEGSMGLCRVCIGIEQIIEWDNNISCFVSLCACFNF